jgi:hypothetical protein
MEATPTALRLMDGLGYSRLLIVLTSVLEDTHQRHQPRKALQDADESER